MNCCNLMWLVLFLTLTTWAARAMPPQPPVQCDGSGCNVSNAYGVWPDRTNCHAPSIIYPKTEEEIRQAVAHAVKNNLRVKTVTKFSHSIPKLACPNSGPNNLLISTSMYGSGVDIDAAASTVTADSGVPLRDLIDKVEEAGFSLVTAPYWEGVTVGGLISTGSHGSSWWGRGGSVHDHLVGISLVVPAKQSEGLAKVVRLDAVKDAHMLNAVKVSLGLLGVISKVKLSVERAFKRSITYNFTLDADLEDVFVQHAKRYEFGDITWYPSKRTAVYRYDSRVPANTSGDGVNDFIGFRPNFILISEAVRLTEKGFESSRSVTGKCLMADTVIAYKKLNANGLKKDGSTGYPVIGRQGKMQTSGSCLYSPSSTTISACSWDPRINGLFFYESTAVFPASKFGLFIRDIKKLRDINPNNFCGIDIYNGFLIRFVKSSQAYLGQSEDSVVLDFNYYRSRDPSVPRLNQDLMEEVEQIAFFKYGARPHWAKNRNLAFFGVKEKYPNFNKFMEVKKMLDPGNVFSSEWIDELLFGREGSGKDGCALEGQCICSEDRHCSPSKGYFCKAGLVYAEARVCRYSTTSNVSSAI